MYSLGAVFHEILTGSSMVPVLATYEMTILHIMTRPVPALQPLCPAAPGALAALIGRNQTLALSDHLKLALDHGVKPTEISEIITHLAFYSGWANAMAAVVATKEVFAERNIGPDRLPAASPALLPLNEAAEADRAKRVGDQFGAMFPGVVQYTTDVLFRDLWLRPDLAPRDRSLVTISALIANGQVAQLTGHIPIGMNNGLTQPEIAEAITHLAFYVGWPNVFSAMPVAKEVFEKRAR
jgi:4-carboxymuconolactone decarboxylase